VLVWHDLLGLYDGHAPRFVKQYAELAPTIGAAVEQYATEVRSGAFPEDKHTYSMSEQELALFEESLAEVRAR
jgi:3-methyl-2-oxobutanoate hydroxymethyltransferase